MSLFQVGKSAYPFASQRSGSQSNSALFGSGKNSSLPSVRQQPKNNATKNQLLRSLESYSENSTSLASVGTNLTEEERQRRIRAVQAKNTFKSTTQAKQANGYMDLHSTSKTQSTPTSKLKYNAKEISSAISQAKTSVSAGKAVIKAKRKILELKRALVRGDGDKNEVMVALNHAKQMERVAKKKKHHLELEELVEHTQKMDEKMEQQEEANSSGGFSNFDFIEEAKDKISEAEDQILSEVENSSESNTSEILESSEYDISEIMESSDIDFTSEISDMAEFSDEMSSLASEELERLDEAMEFLENLEVVDPHMSEEDLKKLKIKHRNSEQKDLVKADMDYLKNMIKLTIERENAQMSGLSSAAAVPMAAPSPAPVFVDVSV